MALILDRRTGAGGNYDFADAGQKSRILVASTLGVAGP
jgi:hypothetical protein